MGPPKEIGPFANSTLFFCQWSTGFCIIKGIKKANANILWFIIFQLLNLMVFGAVLGNRKGNLVFPTFAATQGYRDRCNIIDCIHKNICFWKSLWSNSNCIMQHIKIVERFSKLIQVNLHETNLLYRYLSHHLTWHCLIISGFSPVLVCCDHKIVLHWYENQNKKHLVIMLRKSWEIIRNQVTISCQIVANISKL